MWSIHTLEYHSAVKRGEALTLVTVWMDLGHMMLIRGARHKRSHRVWFHSCDTSRTGASTEMGSGFMVARGWGGRWEVIADEDRVSFWGDGNGLELNKGDDASLRWCI